jgi:hypothetical protein
MRFISISICLIFVGMLAVGCENGDRISDPTTVAEDPDSEDFLLKQFNAQRDPGVVKVMTRNVYVGTDFDIVLGAEDPTLIPIYVAQIFELLQQTDFYGRALALAKEVKITKPHLIGLQEISLIRIQSPGDFLIGNPGDADQVIYDYLEIYMNALAAHDLHYQVAVVGQNIDIELPMATDFNDQGFPIAYDDVRLTDYDVILVRNDVQFSDPVSKRFQYFLPVNDLISVPSGYVAVTAQIGKETYRFVNTHLDAGPVEDIRLGQAAELLTDLASECLPIIMVGDFNTPAPENSTYQFIVASGYHDTWLEQKPNNWQDGDTYGHDADLKNEDVDFYERIDFIFYRNYAPLVGPVVILGDEYHNRTPEGLWPSDHAGVVTKLNNTH